MKSQRSGIPPCNVTKVRERARERGGGVVRAKHKRVAN